MISHNKHDVRCWRVWWGRVSATGPTAVARQSGWRADKRQDQSLFRTRRQCKPLIKSAVHGVTPVKDLLKACHCLINRSVGAAKLAGLKGRGRGDESRGAAQESHRINYTCSLFPATTYLYSVFFFFLTHEELHDGYCYTVLWKQESSFKHQSSCGRGVGVWICVSGAWGGGLGVDCCSVWSAKGQQNEQSAVGWLSVFGLLWALHLALDLTLVAELRCDDVRTTL